MELSKELIRKIPKTDLHVHLDGSLRLNTILDLAKQQHIELPTQNPDELEKLICCNGRCTSLDEYLKAFEITLKVMQDQTSLTRIAYELAEDSAQENIRYMEVRYCPALHTEKGLSLEQVNDAVLAGLKQAEEAFNIITAVIICGLKHLAPATSLQLAQLAVAYKGKGVVAFDLAGAELGFSALDHKAAIELCQQHNLNLTIHAGEAGGPENIKEALHHLGAHRIGHGTHLFEDGDLLDYVNDHRIPLEVCLTSNVDTQAVNSLREHPFKEYLDHVLQVTLNTDNRLVSNTTLTDEYCKAIEAFDLSFSEVKRIALNGFNNAFLPFQKKLEMIQAIKKEINVSNIQV